MKTENQIGQNGKSEQEMTDVDNPFGINDNPFSNETWDETRDESMSERNETDEENEIEVTELEAAVAASKYETGWAQGGLQRDHLIQTLLKLTESFGVYRSVAGEVVDGQVSYQDVFYKGTYALENVEGLRQ